MLVLHALVAVATLVGTVLQGVVRDTRTGEPVAGAIVEIVDIGRATISDSAGGYRLPDVPAGTHELRFSRLGYASQSLSVLVSAAGPQVVDVRLPQDPLPVRSVDLVLPRATATRLDLTTRFHEIGGQSRTAEELRADPVIAEPDLLATWEGALGVAIDPESPTALAIRGGSGDQTQVLIDGVPVYDPVHAGGLFSALTPDAFSRVDIHTGVFSPRFGSALSGVVEARTRTPDAERVRSAGTLSPHAVSLTVDGPIPGWGGLLLSGRRGFPSFFQDGPDDSHLRGATTDVLAKLSGEVLGGTLEALVYQNDDGLAFPAVRSADLDPAALPLNRFDWESTTAGLTWGRPMGDESQLSVSAWRAQSEAALEWSPEESPRRVRSGRGGDGVRVSLARLRSDGLATVGLQLDRESFDYEALEAGTDGGPQTFSASAAPTTGAVFYERLWQGERTQLATGLRAGLRSGVGPTIEPRVSWSVRLGPGVRLGAGYARTTQALQSGRNWESVVTRLDGAGLPLELDGGAVASSDQVASELDLERAGWRVTLGTYARWMRGLAIVAPTTAAPFAIVDPLAGRGTAWGAGVQLERGSRRVALRLAYGLGGTSLTTSAGDYVPSTDRTQTFVAGVGYAPAERTWLRAALRAATGSPATPLGGPFEWESCNLVDHGCEAAGSPERIAGPLNESRLPAYVRLDLGARRAWSPRFLGPDGRLAAFVTVSNVLGRRNVLAYGEETGSGSLRPILLRPPSVLALGLDWSR